MADNVDDTIDTVFTVALCDLRPYIPKFTYVGTMSEIMSEMKSKNSCAHKCLGDAIIDAATGDDLEPISVWHKYHGAVIVCGDDVATAEAEMRNEWEPEGYEEQQIMVQEMMKMMQI